MSNLKQKKRLLAILFLPCLIISLSACISHLYDAKYFYAEGQRFSRNYQGENAVAAFKKAREKAALEVKQHPSSQAYMIKGLAELNLEMWDKAEDSFLKAFAYGFEKGEEWAEHLSLFGLASSRVERSSSKTVISPAWQPIGIRIFLCVRLCLKKERNAAKCYPLCLKPQKNYPTRI